MEDSAIKPEVPKITELKSLRESKGLTLADVFQFTRISVVNLDAIEREDFQVLPPPVITRSFIKTYIKTLGGDGGDVLSRYEQYIGSRQESLKKLDIDPPLEPRKKTYKQFLWGLFILIVIVITAFSITSYKNNVDISNGQADQSLYQTALPTPESKNMPDTTKSETTDQMNQGQAVQENISQTPESAQMPAKTDKPTDRPDTQPSAATIEKTKQKQETDLYRLTIEAKEPSWIRIKAGQNDSREILLKPGEKIERSASSFNLDIGNAGGITIDFQGKLMENLGERGQVVHLKLP
jgi:cytoskeleton protein RodZ